jgi:hypothetical protein
MIELLRVTCEARDSSPLPVDAQAIDAIRAEIQRLSEAWSVPPVGGTLTLRCD